MTRRQARRVRRSAHALQRRTALAQVIPPPNPVSRRLSPSCTRPLLEGVVEGEGDGRRGGVAVAVDHDGRALLGDAEALAGGLDDADVGLVRHHQRDVVGTEPGVGHGPLGRLDDDPDGTAEDLLAVHVERAPVLALEQVPQRAVGVQVPAEQGARAVDRLDHDGAGAVADDDGDLAVVHVGDARERLGADQQHRARPDGDEPGHRDEAVDEARAGGVEVERATPHADAVLHGRCGAGDDAVGRRGRQHQVVDLVGRPAGAGERRLRRLDGQAATWCRRCGARGSRCARRSTRRWCRGCTARSSLVTTLSGTAMPQPVIRIPLTRPTRRGPRGCRRTRHPRR